MSNLSLIESPFRCLSSHHSVDTVCSPFLNLAVSANFLALHHLNFSCRVFCRVPRSSSPHLSNASILFHNAEAMGKSRILFLLVFVLFPTTFCAVPLAPSCWSVSCIFPGKRIFLCAVPSQCLLVTKVFPVSASSSNLSWSVRCPVPFPETGGEVLFCLFQRLFRRC